MLRPYQWGRSIFCWKGETPMARKIIDMSQSPRAGQFAYFSAMADPWAGATMMVDITDFLPAIRARGLPFFLSFLFAISRAGNAVPELRRRLLPDGTVVEYDLCQPSYTAIKPDGAYVYVDVDGGISDLRAFCAQGKANQAAAIEKGVLAEGGDVLDHFFISSVPWLHYAQIKLPSGMPGDSHPRISWGKYQEENGRVTLPVTLYVHHALADGWHISRFFENLRRELDAITNDKEI